MVEINPITCLAVLLIALLGIVVGAIVGIFVGSTTSNHTRGWEELHEQNEEDEET